MSPRFCKATFKSRKVNVLQHKVCFYALKVLKKVITCKIFQKVFGFSENRVSSAVFLFCCSKANLLVLNCSTALSGW